MTEILLRLFVGDYKDASNPDSYMKIGKLAGKTGIFLNLLLSFVKIAAGIISGSISVIADGMNNMSDTVSAVLTLLGFHMANKPADKDHPYGHARYEYLSGLFIAVFVILVGIELGKSSIEKIIMPSAVNFSNLTFGILIFAVILKLWMTVFYKKLGKRIKSHTLKVASVDSRNDAIATAAVFLGAIFQKTLGVSLDGYIGTLVAVFILISGIKAVGETISPILGKRADSELIEAITELVISHDKILGVHDILVHDYGPGRCFASLHAELSAEEDSLICHDIIDDIECDAETELNVKLVIHYDPIEVNNKERNSLEMITAKIINDIDSELSFHDFRMVRGSMGTKLVFDLAVPYSMDMPNKEIKNKIDEKLKSYEINYPTLIRFDEKI